MRITIYMYTYIFLCTVRISGKEVMKLKGVLALEEGSEKRNVFVHFNSLNNFASRIIQCSISMLLL